jgi:hypothetical protein
VTRLATANTWAPEPVPTPLAITGAVYNDAATRTLVVRLSESAGGYEQSLWREAHGALSRTQDRGTPANLSALYTGVRKRNTAD